MVEYTYDAWGAPLSTTGSLASTLGVANPFRYRSYYFDSESGLYYCNARYYNAEWGRWVSADTPFDFGAGILAPNLFAYCANNPVIYRDSTGRVVAIVILGFSITIAEAVALASLLIFSVAYLTMKGFRDAINQAIVWAIDGTIMSADRIVKQFPRVGIWAAETIASLVVAQTVAKADAKVKSTVKKGLSVQYWSANLKTGFVDIGRPLTYVQALAEVKAGRSVFTVTKALAYALALAAGGAIHDPKHKNAIGYYNHYHVNRKNPAHIWYLF